jgi:transposase
MDQVIIGVDPHKLSATIEVVDQDEQLLGSGRFTTDRAGYAAMRKYAKTWPDRLWAVEGANGVGRPLAQRLLEAGEHVVDVPAKLAARVRLFDTGHNRKTDARDAHSIAVVAVRTPSLRVLKVDGELEAMRMLTDRREALTRRRVQTVCRLQALLADLLPGQAKRDITTGQAKAMLATRPATRHRREDTPLYRRRRAGRADRRRREDQEVHRRAKGHGLGPRVTAHGHPWRRRRGGSTDPGRCRRHRPGGEQNRHRLSRAGNRRVNHMIDIAAVTQLRLDTEGRDYYRRKRAAGKKPKEAIRCLKRGLSDAVYKQLVDDAQRTQSADPGGHCGATQQSSAVDLPPHIDTSDQPLRDPHTRRYAPQRPPRKSTTVRTLQTTG